MKIIGLVEHPDHVCSRYRLAALRPHLAQHGHSLDLRSIPRGVVSRLRLWWSLREADVVILQRRLLSSWNLLLLRRHSRRLIFDFDDAVYIRDSYTNKGTESAVRRRRFIATLHAADEVVAGNSFLHAEACGLVSSERVHVVPTCIDPLAYTLADHWRAGPGVQMVWIGSSSTLRGLERRRPLLDIIARHVPGVQCKIICDRFPRFKRMPVLSVPWSAVTETRELASADIGFSWVPDDRWSRGKCGLKVLQYLAAGLPVVANRVGVQTEMIQQEVTGFQADTPAEWVQAIRQLVHEPELRRRMGQAGRRLVESEYSVQAAARRWLAILDRRNQKQVA